MSLWLLGFRIANWIEGNFELNQENWKKPERWGKVKSDVEPAGSQEHLGKVAPEKRRKIYCERWVTTGSGVGGRENERLLEQYFEEDEAASVSLGVIRKKQPLCPSSTWNNAKCLQKSLTRSSFPLIPIHTSTGNLLLPSPSMTTVMPVAEICAMVSVFPALLILEVSKCKDAKNMLMKS